MFQGKIIRNVEVMEGESAPGFEEPPKGPVLIWLPFQVEEV